MRRALFLVACVAVIVISFFVGRFERERTAFTCDVTPTSKCVESFYTELIEEEGAIAALNDLTLRINESAPVRTFCHPLLHLIGSAASQEFDSIADAYLYGNSVCRSGYYHGVLEGVFGEEGADALLSELDSLCTQIRGKNDYSYEYFSCVHGIGHGLMAYTNHDVFASLEGCDRLTGAWEQSSCHGGVFMENVISDTPEMPSRFLKQDDVLYPCTAVADRYRSQCFLMQTSYVLAHNGGDFEHAFALCETVEMPHRLRCFESIGRDASGWTDSDSEAMGAHCMLTENRTAQEHCLIGAAVDTLQTRGADAAKHTCAISPEHAAACADALSMHLKVQ